jgi:hypothetical protein
MSHTSPWPDEVQALFERAITVEYASLTKSGVPIMVPVTPYVSADSTTLDVTTGLAYPAKADRARRNPKVTLLFADGVGSGLSKPPVVMVQGLASVRSADLQANTDRYVAASLTKLPAAYRGSPKVLLRRLAPYFARLWIEVTPIRMLLWESRSLDQAATEWLADSGITAPPSDPAPTGRPPGAWLPPPRDWREQADHWVQDLELADIAWVGRDGWPVSVPTLAIERTDSGFGIELGAFAPDAPSGPSTLTLHTHSPNFSTQENHTFVGTLTQSGSGLNFEADRVLADVSLRGNKIRRTMDFLSKVRLLGTRLDEEAARYGQTAPTIKFQVPAG